MAATTKLIVYNAALLEIAAAPLADTTTANTSQQALAGAWDHAVEYTLSRKDWGFARRRSSLTGTSDTSFPPYLYRFTKPSDYLRKCWLKTAAPDDYQIDHAEIAAVFYSMTSSAVIEYVSDHADNYDPANWPPHFTRALTLYLASLVAPKIARAGAEDLGRLNGQFNQALDEADSYETVFLTNAAIAANRQPVMRRAIEFMGQQLAGSVAIHSHTDMLRWHMNRSWDHAVKYVLEQGAWNFATERALLNGGTTADTIVPSTDGGVIEGYSISPAATETTTTPLTEYVYGYTLPTTFLHKIWIKRDPNLDTECNHQFMGGYVFVNDDPVVMEYVALSDFSTTPTNWPATFLETVACYLALLVAPELVIEAGAKGKPKVTAPQIRDKLEGLFLRKLSDAKMKDAIQQQPKTIPLGRWSRSRMGSMGSANLRRYN